VLFDTVGIIDLSARKPLAGFRAVSPSSSLGRLSGKPQGVRRNLDGHTTGKGNFYAPTRSGAVGIITVQSCELLCVVISNVQQAGHRHLADRIHAPGHHKSFCAPKG